MDKVLTACQDGVCVKPWSSSPASAPAEETAAPPTEHRDANGTSNETRAIMADDTDGKRSADEKAMKRYVVIKVKSANLVKNFELVGRMDPAATVEWVSSDGGGGGGGGETTKSLVSRTHTDWNSHKSPVWDYTCRGVPYSGVGSGDSVVITVWEDDHVGKSDFMGSATVLVDDLLGDAAEAAAGGGGGGSGDRTLPLVYKKGKENGTVTVQATLVERGGGGGGGASASAATAAARGTTDDVEPTRVPPEMFKVPVKRLGVSGGTAPFFELTLNNPPPGKSPSHYIGKDLSRAVDEIAFYEEMLAVQAQPGPSDDGLKGLLDYAFEYAGVLTAPEADVPDSEPDRDLLVLRNLRDGCATLRLLDLKMGQKTASAGWQGKSWKRAKKQGIFDKTTNSYVEGYRLEGFDGKPETLESMDPLLDMDSRKSAKSIKKAGRLMLQHMTGSEILMHFLDLHLGPTSDDDANLDDVYGAAELGELVMHETVRRLAGLAAACQKVTVPQKWVGSSVALGYDCGALPARSGGEEAVRDTVLVNIFDWGRSELNTLEREMNLTAEEQLDRKAYWGYYKGGIERLSYVAAQTYFHRYGNAGSWETATLTVYDFDAILKDDFMGRLVLPLKETPLTEAELSNATGKKSVGTLSYSVHWRPCPAGSRLRGTWRVQVKGAKDLPNMDRDSVSDPYCVVSATSADGSHTLEQVTRVRPNDLNPTWDEVLDLPVASDPGALREALEEGKADLVGGNLADMLPYQGMNSTGTVLRSAVAGVSKKNESSPEYQDWVRRLQC